MMHGQQNVKFHGANSFVSFLTNSLSTSQEILRILCPTVHYHDHKSSSYVPILCQINPVRSDINMKIILKWIIQKNFVIWFNCLNLVELF